MASIREIAIGQRVSFEVYPTSVLGSRYRDVVLDGTISPHTAIMMGYDIAALHANVYSSLPPGTPNDPYMYNYVAIRHPNGTREIVGEPCIRSETLEALTAGRVTLVFENKTQADIDRMLMALSANGYSPTETMTSD